MCKDFSPPTPPAPDDPFGGTPDNWTLADSFDRDVPASPWPPTDPAELAALNAWADEQEREWLERLERQETA